MACQCRFDTPHSCFSCTQAKESFRFFQSLTKLWLAFFAALGMAAIAYLCCVLLAPRILGTAITQDDGLSQVEQNRAKTFVAALGFGFFAFGATLGITLGLYCFRRWNESKRCWSITLLLEMLAAVILVLCFVLTAERSLGMVTHGDAPSQINGPDAKSRVMLPLVLGYLGGGVLLGYLFVCARRFDMDVQEIITRDRDLDFQCKGSAS